MIHDDESEVAWGDPSHCVMTMRHLSDEPLLHAVGSTHRALPTPSLPAPPALPRRPFATARARTDDDLYHARRMTPSD